MQLVANPAFDTAAPTSRPPLTAAELRGVDEDARRLRAILEFAVLAELLFFVLVFIVVVYWRGLVGVRASEASSRVDTITWDADYREPPRPSRPREVSGSPGRENYYSQ